MDVLASGLAEYELATLAAGRQSITREQFAEFERAWVLYALKDLRYGQAFCEHFGMDNATPLYYFSDNKIAKRWITHKYVAKENNDQETEV